MENEELNILIEKYKLTKEEHERVLQQLIQSIFSSKTPKNNPSIMFVIGQPGSGKTTFIDSLDLSEYTIINSDEYRKYNKSYREILEQYPTYYSKLTNYDAHLWGDELFLYGVNNGYSVLREKAPIDFRLLDGIKELFSKNNLLINVLVTGNLTSLLATRERYEREILKSRYAKLSNIDAHNKCYDLLPQFIFNCLKLGINIAYVIPSNNEFAIITSDDDSLTVLEQLRKESNNNTCETFESRMEMIKKSMANRNASRKEFEELDRIQKMYEEIVR